ncbi:hypothetical protein AB0M28_01565 [Streptomyces sp. NPDC051940]
MDYHHVLDELESAEQDLGLAALDPDEPDPDPAPPRLHAIPGGASGDGA